MQGEPSNNPNFNRLQPNLKTNLTFQLMILTSRKRTNRCLYCALFICTLTTPALWIL